MTNDDTGAPRRRRGGAEKDANVNEGEGLLARKGRSEKKSMTVYIDPAIFTKAKIAALVLDITLEQFVEKALTDATMKVDIPRLD